MQQECPMMGNVMLHGTWQTCLARRTTTFGREASTG
eukprot:CAMPEP_0181313514 /NCGR_PEP_ID=MMETSP1101-20121128/14288_1 /TAXON_ID=46948 /ORGANISM="Rhodomonas abbreviata, Strain Caron Lab Isolate" /LENGTH=35 /DNA_ID= /DNA_START= /DNA_END= /DNA_ORIENTATION=